MSRDTSWIETEQGAFNLATAATVVAIGPQGIGGYNIHYGHDLVVLFVVPPADDPGHAEGARTATRIRKYIHNHRIPDTG